MKAAVCKWNDLVAPVFDASGEIVVVHLTREEIAILEHVDISDLDGLAMIRKLSNLGIEVLICGAISRLWHEILIAGEIQVISFVSGQIHSFLRMLIEGGSEPEPKIFMPGCPQSILEHNLEQINKVAAALQKRD